jgi:recombination protein RecA
MSFDENNLEKVLTAIEKKYGKDSIRKAGTVPDVERIPTGIIELDSLMGGGFPLGRWSHVYGGYSSGKTLVTLHLIKEAQKAGYSCAYYDIENQFNREWAESIGVDVDELWLVDGSVIEDTGEKLEALLEAINVHVIDSLALGVSVDELSTSADEWRVGISSRAWGKILRRANNYFDKEKNMVVMVNQVREAFGKMVTETPTGGRQVEHISSMSLHFKRSSWLFADKNGNLSPDATKNKTLHGDTKAAGIELQIKLAKSRLNDPLDSTRIRLEFGTGGQFDQKWSLARAAIFHELVQKNGSWYVLPNGEKVQGEAGLRGYMDENEDFMQAAKNAMLGL